MMMNKQEVLLFAPPELLIKRFCQEHSVSETEARERFEETKKFLVLSATNRHNIYSPSEQIDEMWHCFLLNTKYYHEFCRRLGCFVHHQPSEKPQPENYARTRIDLESLFGELNVKYWSEKNGDCDGGSSCDCCPFAEI